jgi:hypothetical protein
MNQDEFIEICKDRKLWQWLRNKSIVPYKSIADKETYLKSLFSKIKNRTYYPNPPKEYLTVNKGHGVLRIIPVLNLEDLIVYYYCTRKLETYIAVNHIPGTYGGFGLSGKLRRTEEEEVNSINEDLTTFELDGHTYVFYEIEGYPVRVLLTLKHGKQNGETSMTRFITILSLLKIIYQMEKELL